MRGGVETPPTQFRGLLSSGSLYSALLYSALLSSVLLYSVLLYSGFLWRCCKVGDILRSDGALAVGNCKDVAVRHLRRRGVVATYPIRRWRGVVATQLIRRRRGRTPLATACAAHSVRGIRRYAPDAPTARAHPSSDRLRGSFRSGDTSLRTIAAVATNLEAILDFATLSFCLASSNATCPRHMSCNCQNEITVRMKSSFYMKRSGV